MNSRPTYDDGPTLSAGYRWVVLAVGSASQASVSIVLVGIAVLAPQLREHFHLSLGATGVALAALSIGMTPTLLLWGMLADRVGERFVLAVGLAGASVALVAAGLVSRFEAFIALLIAAGALSASVNAASGRAVMQWFPREERGLALGIRQANVPLGGLIAALALPPLVARAGIGWTFGALGGLCALGAIAGAVWLRNPPAREKPLVRTRPLRDPAAWRISWASGLLVIAQTATMSFTVLFLHSERGFGLGAAAAVLAASQVLGVALRIVAGLWSDRTGVRIVPLRSLALVIAATLAVLAALARAPGWALVPTLVVAGALGLSWNGLSFTAAAENAGVGAVGAALGLQQTILGIGGIGAPIGFAAVVSGASWRTAFLAAAAFPLLAWAVLRPLAER
jgi:sugar phosphate permease